MLEVRNLTKRFRSLTVVDHVNFCVRAGEITGYLGPNGSGKSTTVKMMTGLLHPTEGEILFQGRNIRENPTLFKQQLARLCSRRAKSVRISDRAGISATGGRVARVAGCMGG